MRILLKRSLAFSSTLTLLCASGLAFGSGFALNEESTALMGNAYAGAAASAASPGSEYYNPAQAVMIKKPAITLGGALIPVSLKFSGKWYNGASETAHTNGDVTADATNFVPNIHFVSPLFKKWYFAFGLTVPYGLKTDYDISNWSDITIGMPTLTSISAININPSVAYAVTPKLAIAAGFDAMRGEAQYNAKISTADFENDLSGWAYGYNLGVLYQLGSSTRIGLSYRSKMNIDASGPSQLLDSTGQPIPGIDQTTAKATLHLPDTTMLSAWHQFSPRVDVVGSVFYTNWSVLKDITIKNPAAHGLIPSPLVSTLNFKSTWFSSIGMDYLLNRKVKLSAGLGYDLTPTQDGYRDMRLPGANRTVLALGVHFQTQKQTVVDFGYQHLFVSKAAVNDSKRPESGVPITGFHAIGTATMDVNLYGVSLTTRF